MVEILTLGGARADPGEASIAKLRGSLRGGLVLAGDATYESARRVWNGNVDRRPALIARCADPADVQHAVRFAGTHGLLLSVRGGGHSAPGYGTNDGGMVIDLSPMKTIAVDPASRTVRAEGGVLWREFDQATQVHGLATTGGTVRRNALTDFVESAAAVRIAVIAPMLCPIAYGVTRAWARANAIAAAIASTQSSMPRNVPPDAPSLCPGKSRLKISNPCVARNEHRKSRLCLLDEYPCPTTIDTSRGRRAR